MDNRVTEGNQARYGRTYRRHNVQSELEYPITSPFRVNLAQSGMMSGNNYFIWSQRSRFRVKNEKTLYNVPIYFVRIFICLLKQIPCGFLILSNFQKGNETQPKGNFILALHSSSRKQQERVLKPSDNVCPCTCFYALNFSIFKVHSQLKLLFVYHN